MSYSVELKKSATKSLKKLPKKSQAGIVKKLLELETSLPPVEQTKLKGNNPFHKIRVGDYRIIYEIHDDVLVILVVKIGHRKEVYKTIS